MPRTALSFARPPRKGGWGTVCGLCLVLGCYGGRQDGVDGQGADGADSVGDAGDGADGGDDDGGEPSEGACDDELPLVAMRFLTRAEYDHTIADLLGDGLDPTTAFPPDDAAGGYYANSTLAPSQTQLEAFIDAAQNLGIVAVADRLDRFVDCAPADAGCAESFVREFGSKAFRRPLEDAEVAAYVGDFDALAPDQGPEVALQVVAASMLASPHFLYIAQRSELPDDTAHAYDLASRLSYFLWSTMPDDELLAAAAAGDLSTAEGVQAQVRRMIEDDRASQMLGSFATQWLEVSALADTTTKSPELFPEWTPALAEAAEREAAELLRHVVRDGDGTLQSLLTSRQAYVDADLAALYGVPAPAGGEGWVELPEGERSGALTRAALLARHSHAEDNSWVHRGKLVRERLLCGELPPPPPVADDSPINDDSRLQDPMCMGCHTLMDPIGVGFEGYDPVGRYVGGSAPGQVEGIDAAVFDGALELSANLATAPEVTACFAEQMYRYANRRALEDGDACRVEAMSAAFVETEGDIVELIVAIATADTFRGGAQ